ncbi:MAG TPA: hypothetical protein EYG69_04475 [Campylobacterales bacterium]|nr:hypothetical protein [Campylobacterales bacterium]
MKYWLILITVLFLSSCGYKPTHIYTKNVLGDKIYVDVEISLSDPQNSVLITDSINEAVISKFRSSLVSENRADFKLKVSLNSIGFTPIQYDDDGYVISYKSVVSLKINYIDRFSKTQTITSSGDYDFSIEANSIISDNKRFEAIKFAALKAIDQFISKISVRGYNLKGSEK